MKFDLNKIYQGDSLKLLEEIEDNSIDLIVCDGPYGVTENEWDKISNIQEFNLNLIKIFSRILKLVEVFIYLEKTIVLILLIIDLI